jgi:FR47-like protein.
MANKPEVFLTLCRSTRIEPMIGFQPPHEVIIRKVEPGDAERIGALLHYGFKDTIHGARYPGTREGIIEIHNCFQKQNVIFDASYVATFDDDAVCATIVNSYTGMPWLFYVCTHPSFRAYGLATHLITSSLRAVHGKGHIDMYLNVAQRNERALRLYLSMGFERFRQTRFLA